MKIDQALLTSLKKSPIQRLLAGLVLTSFCACLGVGFAHMAGTDIDPLWFVVLFGVTLSLAIGAGLYTLYGVTCPLCGGGPIKIINLSVKHDLACEITQMDDMPLSVRGARATLKTKKRGWYIDGYRCSNCHATAVTGLNNRT